MANNMLCGVRSVGVRKRERKIERGGGGEGERESSDKLSRVQGSRHTFECRVYGFYDSGFFVRRRGVTCALNFAAAPRIEVRSRTTRMCKDMLGEVAVVKKWRPRTSCTACTSKKNVGCQRVLRRSCKVCLFPQ